MTSLRWFYLFIFWIVSGLLLSSNFLLAQNQYNYSYVPKKVYENQLFPVTIIAIGDEGSNHPQFTFDLSSKIQPLSKKPLVARNEKDTFYTFYFKAKTKDMQTPQLFISSDSTEASLQAHTVFVEKLEKRSDFSQVMAADMQIKNAQVSYYDTKNYIVTFNIEAFEANVEDMKLSNVLESGLENIQRHDAKVKAAFYVVVPVKKKILTFSYFNTIKKQYVILDVPIKVMDASVTTQSDLNPIEDSFKKLKRYTLIALSIFFLIMFIWRRDFFYLVLAVITIITLLTLYIPHKKICVTQGAPLYILPTHTSTISTYIDAKYDTMLLAESTGYKKIAYQKHIIGWIKDEDICKD